MVDWLCSECSPLDRPRGGYWACTVTEASSLRNCTFFCLRGFVVAVQPPPFTCGPDTSYLWNHQRDHELGSAAPLPECIGEMEKKVFDGDDGGDDDSL